MMETKCNKTQNNNNMNKKCMDHMYCHINPNSKSFNNNNQMTAAGGGNNNGTSSSNADMLALLKENKQLKAMLILHLNLIQEQGDQLIAKEKILVTQNEELERLTALNIALKNQISELQSQLQRQLKRTGEFTAVPPPPLAKIQSKPPTTTTTVIPLSTTITNSFQSNAEAITSSSIGQPSQSAIIGECNGKLISKIILQRVHMPRNQAMHSPQSLSTDTEENEEYNDDITVDEGNKDEENEENKEITITPINIIGDVVEQSEDKNKSVINTEDLEDTGNTTEDSNEVLAIQSKRIRLRQEVKQSLEVPRGAKPSIILPDIKQTNKGIFKSVTPAKNQTAPTTTPTLSRGKHLPLMRWHAPDYHSDETASCDSTPETDRPSILETPSSPTKDSSLQSSGESKVFAPLATITPLPPSHSRDSCARSGRLKHCSYISTSQLYCCREWENEITDNNYEFIKAEAKALVADAPMLEIPKWTEHELTPSYCIEGTEDLSDDTFFKRHAKLEICEKRRKKWDVQQIRESRRIERLKRRHCKDEIPTTQEPAMLHSFYPSSDTVQTIQFIQDLPVQAFGEMIPRLSVSNADHNEFRLPWLHVDIPNICNNSISATLPSVPGLPKNVSYSTQQQHMLNSAFVFLKKRKRQQSSSVTVSTTLRQRILAAKAASLSSTSINGQNSQQLLSATVKNKNDNNNSTSSTSKSAITTNSIATTYTICSSSDTIL